MLEWTPEEALEASLLQDRPSLAVCCSVGLHQGNMGDSEPPEILYETCACIILFIIIETLHDHLKSLRDPKPPVLGTRGPRDRSHGVSVYEACAYVIINLLSYMCI